MAALLRLMEERQNLRRERVFRDRLNPLDRYNDLELISRYRLPRHLLVQLINETSVDLKRETRRSVALPVALQVLATLRVLATGSFQKEIGDIHGISKSSMCRVIHPTTQSICQRFGALIHFSTTNREQQQTAEEFLNLANFPNVIGAIDGTLVPIKAPVADEYLYVCRKGYHAINIQAVCNAKMSFTSLVCKFPGSTHDAYIWNGCGLAHRFRDGDMQGKPWWLLGDSGYPLHPYLLTPITHPVDAADNRYNTARKRTRCIIESIWCPKIKISCNS